MRVIIYFAPIGDENTILYLRFYCKMGKIRPINFLISQIGKPGNFIVQRQDKPVVETQIPKSSRLKSRLKIKENLLPCNSPIIAYKNHRESLKILILILKKLTSF